MRRGETVERERGVPHLRGERRADEALDLRVVDVLVVLAGGRLARRREERGGQARRLFEPDRQHMAADRAGALVVLPARTDEIAAHHRLDGQRAQPLHDHRTAREQGALVGVEAQPLEAHVRQLVRHEVGGAAEPEVRDLGQHAALVRDGVGQHHVERGQAVRRDDQHVVLVDLVDVAHLAGVQPAQVAQGGGVHGGHSVDVSHAVSRSPGRMPVIARRSAGDC